jgi:hypothetical protein
LQGIGGEMTDNITKACKDLIDYVDELERQDNPFARVPLVQKVKVLVNLIEISRANKLLEEEK